MNLAALERHLRWYERKVSMRATDGFPVDREREELAALREVVEEKRREAGRAVPFGAGVPR